MRSLRTPAVFLAAVVAVGAAVRLAYQVEIAIEDPTYGLLHGNAASFAKVARVILAGDVWAGDEPFFYGPLYSYFLAACFHVAGGEALWLPRVIQACLGLGTACLTYWIARSCFDETSARCAAVLVALYRTAIFFEGLLVSAALDTFLLAASVALALGAATPPREAADERLSRRPLRRLLVAGACLGLAAWGRGNVIALVPVMAAGLWAAAPPLTGRRARLTRAGAFVLGACLAIAPVTLRNRLAGGEWVLLVTQGGINLFVGNNPEALGLFNLPERAGISMDSDPEYRDLTRSVAEGEVGRTLSEREVSAYWSRRARAWVAGHPGDFVRLTLLKARLLAHPYEIPIHQNAQYYSRETVLGRLPLSTWGLLLPLAVAGLVASPPRLDRRGLLALLAAAGAASIVAFFVVDRYRFSLVPLIAPFAGAGLACLARAAVQAVRSRRLVSARAMAAAAAALVAAALAHGWLPGTEVELLGKPTRRGFMALEHDRHGRSWERLGRLDEAEAAYRRALAEAPGHVASRLDLARVLLATNRPAEAEATLQPLLAAMPSHPGAQRLLAEARSAVTAPPDVSAPP